MPPAERHARQQQEIFNEQAEQNTKPLCERLTKQEDILKVFSKNGQANLVKLANHWSVLASNTALQNETKQLETAMKKSDGSTRPLGRSATATNRRNGGHDRTL